MKAIFIYLLFISIQVEAQFFNEKKPYELMYVESDLVIEAKDIGNKNVIIKKIFRNDDENLSSGDTLYINWLSEFELRKPPENVFLFLKKVDPSTVPAYNTIDVQPVSNSRYEHVHGGVIWYDSTGCYYFSEPDRGYMRLLTVYTNEIPPLPVFAPAISQKLTTFGEYFEKYVAARNRTDTTVKASLLASYLFRKNTPAPGYYDFFAKLELNDPCWSQLSYEYTSALIPYLKECDDTARLIYPLKALQQANGGYYEWVLLPLNDLLKRNTHPEDHYMILNLMEEKGDEYAKAMLRDQMRSKIKQDKELAALNLYSMQDKESYEKIKKILLHKDPEFQKLRNLHKLEPEKTDAFITDILPNYPAESQERLALTEIIK